MAGKKAERTKKMIGSFYELRCLGYSIKKIAEMFNLDPTTVYGYLDEIANQQGVKRETLLDRVFEADHSGSRFAPVRLVNVEEATSHISVMVDEAKALQTRLSHAIAEAEEFAKNYEQGGSLNDKTVSQP